MGTPLRLLMLEDSDDDELLVLSALRAGGYEPMQTRVWSASAMQHALVQADWELIISDYCMPGFDALDALSIARASGRDIPFIIVSGTMGEETAVDAMRAGANDYVMKDSLARLAPSVRRELNEAVGRRARRAAQREVDELALENKRVEALILARNRFLANVSHELRTPLNAIIGFSELLEQGTAGPLLGKQSEYVHYVLSSGRHLLSLVSDILDLSKAEAGKMELVWELTSLDLVAAASCETLQPVATKHGVELELQLAPSLPLLLVDPIRLRQMLFNLLSNAIKFTPSGGKVTLATRKVGGQLEVRVSDTGVGIAQEDLPRLFREFEQMPQQGDSRADGSGLGLALTKKLVELHGGSISASSERGVGSSFALLIPLCPPRLTLEQAARPEPVPAHAADE